MSTTIIGGTEGMGRSADRLFWADPLFVGVVALAVTHVVWFALNFAGPVGPPILGTLPLTAAAGVVVVTYRRASAAAGLSKPARRFWRMFAISAVLLFIAQILALPDMMDGPVGEPGSALAALYFSGLVLMIVALYRLPLGVRSSGERLRLLLDMATVALAGFLVAWYFSLAHVPDTPSARIVVITTGMSVVFAVVLLGTAKVAMSGSRTIDAVALRLVALGFCVELIGMFAAPLLADRPQVATEPLGRAFANILFAAAGVQAARAAYRSPSASRANRRPYSILPYFAVAAVDALLLVVMREHGGTQMGVAVGVVVLTGLVIARQLAAFRDNARLLDELARQERRFRSLVQHAADAIAICDADGHLVYVSPGMERLTGRASETWIGYTGTSMIHPDDVAATQQHFGRVWETPKRPETFRTRIAHADGGWRWVRVTATNLLGDPAVGGLVMNLSDITELEEYHQQLSHQASHDSLTDLANRSLFGEQLEAALARSGGQNLSLALIDLDDFKLVNDTLGHQAGDQLLIEVAERLRRGVRPQDLVARLGGDEFVVLLEGAPPAHVDGIAERMLAILAEPVTVAGRPMCVQASVGIADAQPGLDAEQLMSRADLAMYAAKDTGKGRYARYADDMAPRTSPRAQVTAELHRALASGELELFYQPIVQLPDGERITGVEALLRWRHPERGLVSPLEFIPVAEETGLIVPIGRWVLETACRQAAEWLTRYPASAPGTVSVNVSARQLRDSSIIEDVTDALMASGLAPERLVIEVTESAIVDHAPAAASLQKLRDMGVRIALDDFGTGYSTLSLLHALPVDQLKLDRTLLGSPGHDAVAVVVKKIAETIGAAVVAEGVEATAQAERLHAIGYPLGQGFHFARPAPADEITERLAATPVTTTG